MAEARGSDRPVATPPGATDRGAGGSADRPYRGGAVAVPERRGMGPAAVPDPCVMVVFGAGGDLTRRELVPSLWELDAKGLLPERFAMVGYSRGAMDDDAFREAMWSAVRDECRMDDDRWETFRRRIFFVRGDFGDPEGYRRLSARLGEVREALGIPDNVFFHLAAPPAFFGTIVEGLAAGGLARSADGWRRLVVEKPFGEDRASARGLDEALRSVFPEDRIYRIDHFLGKETVQNMLVFRFANPSFEPIWNRHHIDHVQITVAEDIGIGTRASFYEKTGVLRDMVQNHLLQLLCMAAIEPPVRFDADALRDETGKVLESALVSPPDPARDLVVGQYGPGRVAGERVPAYRKEPGVAEDSGTATFAALRVTLDSWRWAGVPFYLRTGKRLARKLTQVVVHFKPTPHMMFPVDGSRSVHRHRLAFRLQPEESIAQTFVAKRPGPEVSLCPVTMHFGYADAFGIEEPPRAYAWLIHDVMQGRPTLFARSDWIDRAWELVDPLVARSEDPGARTLHGYAAGSWGPGEADRLLERDGRDWTAD